ncbi:MAG TPA: alpha/beta fold hydrolase [Acidimicrobiales bacterium]|nr:alpha/beta fold hydrolase [Acidimicrobiales bacterium]
MVLTAVLVAMALPVIGVGSPSEAATTSSGAQAPSPADPMASTACPTSGGLQCGSVVVPLDYAHRSGPTLTLAVTRKPAADPAHRIGVLLFNPGGPGESGNQILPVILGLLPPAVASRFDIVSFDPRGTGASDPLQCGTSPSAVTSVLPVPTRAGQPLPGTSVFTAMAQACTDRHPALAASLTSDTTARDMDRIRAALGVKQISYLGLSYGTVLGTVYADLFPHRVRAMVLDGGVDVNAPLAIQAADEAPAAERSLQHYLASCAAAPNCPLGADPTATFTSLRHQLEAHPLPAPGNGDNEPVTVGDLDTATLFALSAPAFAPSYPTALVDALHGDGTSLRQLALELDEDISGAPLVDASWAITCNDFASHLTPRTAGAQARSLAARYPLIGGYAVTYNLGGCVAQPKSPHAIGHLHPDHAPPVLLIGNIGDPNTPLVGSRHLAAAFSAATLVTWDGWGHTWLLNGSSDHCMVDVVDGYLILHHLPKPGTQCR